MTAPQPHPFAEATVLCVDAWEFHCGECRARTRMYSFTPTDERGEYLYCSGCAPQQRFVSFDLDNNPLFTDGPAWLWCRRGRHIVDTTAPYGEHLPCRHRKPRPNFRRVCERCGERFAGRSDARYCSGRCRIAAYRERSRG